MEYLCYYHSFGHTVLSCSHSDTFLSALPFKIPFQNPLLIAHSSHLILIFALSHPPSNTIILFQTLRSPRLSTLVPSIVAIAVSSSSSSSDTPIIRIKKRLIIALQSDLQALSVWPRSWLISNQMKFLLAGVGKQGLGNHQDNGFYHHLFKMKYQMMKTTEGNFTTNFWTMSQFYASVSRANNEEILLVMDWDRKYIFLPSTL